MKFRKRPRFRESRVFCPFGTSRSSVSSVSRVATRESEKLPRVFSNRGGGSLGVRFEKRGCFRSKNGFSTLGTVKSTRTSKTEGFRWKRVFFTRFGGFVAHSPIKICNVFMVFMLGTSKSSKRTKKRPEISKITRVWTGNREIVENGGFSRNEGTFRCFLGIRRSDDTFLTNRQLFLEKVWWFFSFQARRRKFYKINL